MPAKEGRADQVFDDVLNLLQEAQAARLAGDEEQAEIRDERLEEGLSFLRYHGSFRSLAF